MALEVGEYIQTYTRTSWKRFKLEMDGRESCHSIHMYSNHLTCIFILIIDLKDFWEKKKKKEEKRKKIPPPPPVDQIYIHPSWLNSKILSYISVHPNGWLIKKNKKKEGAGLCFKWWQNQIHCFLPNFFFFFALLFFPFYYLYSFFSWLMGMSRHRHWILSFNVCPMIWTSSQPPRTLL